MARTGTILLCIAAAVALAGCRKSREEAKIESAIEKQTGGKAKVDLSGDRTKVTVKTEEGTMQFDAGGGAKLPDDFPKDVPIYKGAAVLMSMTEDKNSMVTLQSKDGQEKIVDFYKKTLADGKWEKKGEQSFPNAVILQYEKDTRGLTVSFTAQDDLTHIQIVVTPKD